MKRTNFIIFLFLLLTSLSAIAQTGNQKKTNEIPPPPSPQLEQQAQQDPNFGTYYKIGEYPIRVPFNEQPNISPKAENEVCKLTSYQYAYPKPGDDINILYGIDVCEFKDDKTYKDPKAKVDYLVNNTKQKYGAMAKATLLSETSGGKDGGYFVRQKMKVISKDIGEIYFTSIYFYSRGTVVRLFVFTPNNIDNKRIEDFFASVKFE